MSEVLTQEVKIAQQITSQAMKQGVGVVIQNIGEYNNIQQGIMPGCDNEYWLLLERILEIIPAGTDKPEKLSKDCVIVARGKFGMDIQVAEYLGKSRKVICDWKKKIKG
jgi:hypothetical protein